MVRSAHAVKQGGIVCVCFTVAFVCFVNFIKLHLSINWHIHGFTLIAKCLNGYRRGNKKKKEFDKVLLMGPILANKSSDI